MTKKNEDIFLANRTNYYYACKKNIKKRITDKEKARKVKMVKRYESKLASLMIRVIRWAMII